MNNLNTLDTNIDSAFDARYELAFDNDLVEIKTIELSNEQLNDLYER